ncbi:MAG TPA: phosphatidylglycerophosphatase A [Planctomycetaceae bacterium]|nr:phosphatidylglycerophosphatase A [Planctomycetaceae bacterium]
MIALWDRIAYWPAVGFGLGLVPKAPGTFGSLLGPPLVWAVIHSGLSIWGQILVAVILILLGVPICASGARTLKQEDPGAVVYDEVMAFFLVFIWVSLTWWTAILGFALFRLFDIWKPWPIKRVEKWPGGWGIMADDLLAGLIAGVYLKFAVLGIEILIPGANG